MLKNLQASLKQREKRGLNRYGVDVTSSCCLFCVNTYKSCTRKLFTNEQQTTHTRLTTTRVAFYHHRFHLHKHERFGVRMPYHASSIAAFKTMHTSSYDPISKLWDFHLKEYNQLGELLLLLLLLLLLMFYLT